MAKPRERQNIAEEVTVRKEELLTAVKQNRENHRKEFELAMDGWHDEALAALERMKTEVLAGKRIHVMVNLPLPEDHTSDYDRVIRMLELHVDDEVTIPTQEFSQFVMDEWGWKRQWTTSNVSYMAAATQKSAPKSGR